MRTAKEIIQRHDSLKSDRANWESYWQNLSYYIMPHKAYFTKDRVSGEELPKDLYDSSAVYANQVFAAGLHGYMTNPSSKWFTLRTQDNDIMEKKEVAVWLKKAEDKIYSVLNSSNFNQQIHEAYLDLGCLGTAVFYEEEDERDIVRFYARQLSECYIAEDARERVNEVVRVFELTALQARGKFGDKAGKSVLKALEKRDYTSKFTYYHAVFPRHDRNVSKKDAKNKKFASIWVAKNEQKKVKEGGYDEFPYMAVRFSKTSDEVYGFSSGMVSFADIKMLNRMSKTTIKAGEKAVSPTIILPHDGYVLPLDLRADKINYKRKRTSADEKIETIPVGNVGLGLEMENQRRETIQKSFFVDLFLMLTSQKNMTATEVNERVQEKMLVIGPILGRLMSELLDPIIFRTLLILIKGNHLPPAPAAIQGAMTEVEYVSPLAKAQKFSELNAINNTIGSVTQLAEGVPDIVDNYDMDEVAIEIGMINGINPELRRDPKERDKIRKDRAEAQQAAAQMEMIQQGATAAKTGAEADAKNREGGV